MGRQTGRRAGLWASPHSRSFAIAHSRVEVCRGNHGAPPRTTSVPPPPATMMPCSQRCIHTRPGMNLRLANAHAMLASSCGLNVSTGYTATRSSRSDVGRCCSRANASMPMDTSWGMAVGTSCPHAGTTSSIHCCVGLQESESSMDRMETAQRECERSMHRQRSRLRARQVDQSSIQLWLGA